MSADSSFPAKLVFVIGSGRCGSTLVHEVLARHRAVGFMSNLEDRLPLSASAGRVNSALYRRIPPRFTRKGRLRFAPSEGYRALEREGASILSAPSRDLLESDVTPWLARQVRRTFERRAAVQGRVVFLHKFTGWPRAGFLRAVFPDAVFVNVVRDGRAVVNSWLQMPWWSGFAGPSQWAYGPLPPAYQQEWERSGQSFTVLAGLAWKVLMDAFEEARSKVSTDGWLDLRYEDFLDDPRQSLETIVRFAGFAPDPDFDAAVARYPFDSGRTEAFRADLGAATVAELDRSLGHHLVRWGYPCP
ncbi:MAG: sulfotransferase family protein [Acidimicrobiales bacterium]